MVELTAKHRPSSLERVVGQDAAVEQLKGFLDNGGLPHAILLTGPPGVGKTSIARILATEHLGCTRPDELNIADLTGVDVIREIASKIRLKSIHGKARVHILDECQQMGKPAQQALLKPLEEPPDHAYFIMCTTDPSKLLKPVRSRCTLVRLGPVPEEDMMKLLKRIVKKEKIKTTQDVLDKIVEEADGGARDAVKRLEMIRGIKGEEEQIAAVKAGSEIAEAIELARCLTRTGQYSRATWKDCASILKKLEGHEPEMIRQIVVGYVRSIALNGGMLARCKVIYDEFHQEFYQPKNAGHAQVVFACLEVMGPK